MSKGETSMKKIGILFATIIMVMLFAVSASALEPTGQCGENVYWTFDSTTGELVISGEGAMFDYDSDKSPFFYSEVKIVIIEDGVESIGDNVFHKCYYLTSIIIPNSVVTIGDYAFYGCGNLENIMIPNGLTSIGEGAFSYCANFTQIIIPDSVTTLGDSAFVDCVNLESIIIPNNITIIGNSVFSGCESLKNVTIPNNVTAIGYCAFGGCDSFTSIIIPNSVTIIGDGAFVGCDSLTNIIIPDDVTIIGKDMFRGCISLTNVSLPDNISTIGEWAFFECTSLISISIPSSVTSIGDGAFHQCESLADIYYNGTQEQWREISIGPNNEYLTNATIHFHYGEPHTYTTIITSPTCTKQGYTTYICECGCSYIADYVDANGHSYSSETTILATHLKEGVETFTCHCGDTYDEPIAKLEEHSYIANVILPTCSEKGYTEYLCGCGASYISDYVGMIAHSYVYSVVKPATHLIEGLGRYTCSKCGDHYDEAIAKTKEHSYTSTLVNSTCISQGYTLSECECGDSFKRDYLAKTDHNDSNADGVCDNCGYELKANCSCNCHAGGIKGLIFKLILFFQKFFRMNRICYCGIYHY